MSVVSSVSVLSSFFLFPSQVKSLKLHKHRFDRFHEMCHGTKVTRVTAQKVTRDPCFRPLAKLSSRQSSVSLGIIHCRRGPALVFLNSTLSRQLFNKEQLGKGWMLGSRFLSSWAKTSQEEKVTLSGVLDFLMIPLWLLYCSVSFLLKFKVILPKPLTI